jgi:NADPH:quinone reductase-like Zn-dependent oxidoreductase
MQAVQVLEYGGRNRLTLREIPVPAPAEGEALVQLAYAGVNFIDVYMREGHYRHSATYGAPLPIMRAIVSPIVSAAAVMPSTQSYQPGSLSRCPLKYRSTSPPP